MGFLGSTGRMSATASRTIVSAMYPRRYSESYTEITLTVWFDEGGGFDFTASPFDCERHGRELWIRAMAGEYGPIEVVVKNHEQTVLG